MTTATTHWVLTAVCEDRPGIVHAISGAVLASGGNITESHQYSSLDTLRRAIKKGRVKLEIKRLGTGRKAARVIYLRDLAAGLQ